MNNRRSAFTLIELLVTLAIIAIIVTISTFALQNARTSARDEKRKSDLEMIRSALELYYSDFREYPPAPLPNPGQALTRSGHTYLSAMPADPQNPDQRYSYSRPTTSTYELCASLETPPTSPASCSASCGTRSCNYRHINP